MIFSGTLTTPIEAWRGLVTEENRRVDVRGREVLLPLGEHAFEELDRIVMDADLKFWREDFATFSALQP